MACSKITLTNTGTTSFFFNFRKCSNTQFINADRLRPNQTRNIWIINDTFTSGPKINIKIEEQPFFPNQPKTPTPTPTPINLCYEVLIDENNNFIITENGDYIITKINDC